jgi:hypothetical protein
MVHLTGFKRAVEETYGFRPFYRAYIRDGFIRALFPGFFHRSLIYGRKILSQPFSEYGGILLAGGLGSDETDEIIGSFLDLAEDALRRMKSFHLEMRCPLSLGMEEAGRFHILPLFERATRRLQTPETMWNGLSSKDRNIIQKARSYGLTVSSETSNDPLRTEFYPLYLKTMSRLGTPPHPLKYFRLLGRYLPNSMKVFIVRAGKVPIAALVGWAVGRTVHVTDLCSDEVAFFLRPNDLAVWEFLSWAAVRGYEAFDFGPVRYRGQEIFKKKWKMHLRSYFYAYLTLKPERIKNPFSKSGGFMSLAPKIWKAAMPSGLSRVVGRALRSQIGL